MSSVRATSSHTVKRSASEMDELSSDEEKPDVSSEYEASPSPSPKRKGKRNGKTANGSRSTKKSKTNEPVGEWSPQLRHTLMELIFDRGTEGLNYGELSAKLGLSQIQIKNALQKGRKSNLRWKCLKYVEEL